MKSLVRDKRNVVILLLAALSLLAAAQEGFGLLAWILSGVIAYSLFDLLINRLFFKKKIFPKSAIITGFILSGILDYNQSWLLLLSLSLVAIASKYIIRFRKKHIFNPANFALFLAVILKLPLTWQIESNIYLITIIGIYLAYSLKKLPHIIGFLAFFGGLFLIEKVNPLNLTSWFFVFVMLIEPKTSGYGLIPGFAFGAIAGAASFLVYKFAPELDLFICALFIANLFKIISDIIIRKKHEVKYAT